MPTTLPPNAGLCGNCKHAGPVQNARGSRFVLCQAHRTHQLPKYPALPVLQCIAYQPISQSPSTAGEHKTTNP